MKPSRRTLFEHDTFQGEVTMKIAAIILLLLIPTVSAAQNYQGMNKGDMQKMMQQMQKMQSCMQNVDQAKLKELEQRSNQLEAEVKSLCANGKRDKAQDKAISFGMKMMNDPEMQKMRKCGEMMKGMMPTMPAMPTMPFMDQDKDLSSNHVCD